MSEQKTYKRVEQDDPVPELDIKQGPVRSYIVTDPSVELASLRSMVTMKEKLIVACLAIFTAVIRLHGLAWPNSVVFDEVHFGGFASQYIKGTYFMDVHPPLAKMLYAGVASLGGFQGDFDFENIGDNFPSTTPYVFMRFFSASLGALTVILMYLTLRYSGVRMWVALISALCFAIENSYVTISRYILLDAPLMFFIAAAVYSFKKYEMHPANSWNAYKSLLATGIALGMASSAKWVGFFTVAWVGLLCIWRLWFMIGDLTKSSKSIFKVAIAKLAFLLGVPFALYLVFFYVHFKSLYLDGDGASFFSPEFRSTLQDNKIPHDVVANVGIGSTVSLRHLSTMGGYLHSHSHNYPAGSEQQQITLYPHMDANNEWLLELYNVPGESLVTFENVTDGTKVRLFHSITHCRLHSHDHKPPVSESSDWQKEVSCYGYSGFDGDSNDDWVVEIDKKNSAPGIAQNQVRALETKFRLRHAMTGCYLFSHEVKLPAWGFEQQEVTCASSGRHDLTLWYVENNSNPLLPEDTERISYKPASFISKFIESHKKMWHINKNLVDSHVYESQPTTWPFLLRGISYWGENNRTVYLLGNAVVWWAVTAFIGVFGLIVITELFSWQLGKPILQDSKVVNFHVQVIHYLLGFAIHYAPSFLMQRQMFLHHYLPAYYFGILALGHALDIIVTYVFRNKRQMGYAVLVTFFAASMYFFKSYSPIIYGTPWTQELCQKSQWLSGWDYNCNSYLSTFEEYKNQTLTSRDSQPAATSTVEEITIEEDGPSYEDLMNEEGKKIFKDTEGNELDPEVVKKMLEEEGANILKVEKRAVLE
ncbi:hypothetical protein N7582_001026 [Saccharomyces uvarum]|uniref:Dolichyl-phosphate-mannose--protein mannosyltransferase n=1 Tax=Saccharomyces uvarum TaxID=230603 RepID=A0AA35JDK3_SACUV|nr:hypothetical protein N7582_001026 [Saccharomyces uvarum]CAI4058127.1 hypothetical protein SUVC_04G1490 [Saccharomyces uvarum]